MADHRTLVSADVHEPKHISDSTATDASKVVTPLSGGTSELRNLTPSEVGVEFIYGEMQATQTTDLIAVTAATDPELYTDTDYININSVRLSGVTLDQANGVTLNATNNTLVVPTSGDYRISGWFNISSDTNNSKVGIRYTLNGVVAGATVKNDLAALDRVQNVSGFGFITAAAGDEIGIALACDKSANIRIRDMVVMLDLLRAS